MPENQPIQRFSTLPECIDHYAQVTPEAVACVSGAARLTYRTLAARVDALAQAFSDAGLEPGARVALLAIPGNDFLVVLLAALRAELIWVGLNPRYQLNELAYVIEDCQPDLLLSIGQFEGRQYAEEVAALEKLIPGTRKTVSLDDTLPGADRLETWIKNGSESPGILRPMPLGEAPGVIVYTSGSSGKPKGAVISQSSLAIGAHMQIQHLDVSPQSLIVNFPINHVACVADTCATTLVSGGKIVFQPRFDPSAVLRAVEAEQCNMLGGVPTMLHLLLEDPAFDSCDLSSLQLIAWGGAPMPEAAIHRLESVCPRLMGLYGLTETAANIAFVTQEDGLARLSTSIGRTDTSVAFRVADDADQPVAAGISGELQFKADFFFCGYWNRPEATAAAWTEDGWFRSGDVGLVSADGILTLVGRRSDMFKSGGYNVYPREIETVLEAFTNVAMAAVVGVPDKLYQEVGHAYVVAERGCELDTEALRSACKASLANYKIPKRIEIVDSLPMLPVGKVDKQALRRRAPE